MDVKLGEEKRAWVRRKLHVRLGRYKEARGSYEGGERRSEEGERKSKGGEGRCKGSTLEGATADGRFEKEWNNVGSGGKSNVVEERAVKKEAATKQSGALVEEGLWPRNANHHAVESDSGNFH